MWKNITAERKEVFYLNRDHERSIIEQMYIRHLGGNDEIVTELLKSPNETILLYMTFDHLDWSKGDRSKELQVDLFKEYYVWSGFSLIGNVGGQMGLFIGFSFIGCFEWLSFRLQNAWKWMEWKWKWRQPFPAKH